MGELGTNIDRNIVVNGNVMEDPYGLFLTGAKEIRLPYSPWIHFSDYRAYFGELKNHGMQVKLAFDRASMHDYDWAGSEYLDADAFGVSFFDQVGRELYDYIDSWQLGNEPDIESPSSWTMSQSKFIHLQKVAHTVLGRDRLVCGGLAGGDPEWIRGWALEQYVSKGAYHPYGQGTPDFPSPYGFSGNVVELRDGYQNATGLEFEVSEFGSNLNELGVDFGTVYAANVISWLKKMGKVNQFALRNSVSGFGMFDDEGNARPLFYEFQRMANEESWYEEAFNPQGIRMIGRRMRHNVFPYKPESKVDPAKKLFRPQVVDRYGKIQQFKQP